MKDVFTGPAPEKRLQDLCQLGAAYLTAHNHMDAYLYPDRDDDGWQAGDLAEALNCYMPEYSFDGWVDYSETVGRVMYAKATQIVLDACENGVVPSIDDHRLVVLFFAHNWPSRVKPQALGQFAPPQTWPMEVIVPDHQAFRHQTPEYVTYWAGLVQKERERFAKARRDMEQENCLLPARPKLQAFALSA